MHPPDENSDSAANVQAQLLVDYQIAQYIADHEVQTIYLSFAVFFPLLLTAAASLVAVSFARNIHQTELFFAFGLGGTIWTAVITRAWWHVADRRQEIRTMMFTYLRNDCIRPR